MFKKCFVLFFILLLVGCGSIKSGKISCSEKAIVLDYENSILVDVRTASEYKSGHIEGAINIPYDNIIVYCKSGVRSSQAFDSLKNAGYNNVYDLGAMSNCS